VRPPSFPSLDDLRSADHRRARVDELADAAGGRAGAGLVICLGEVALLVVYMEVALATSGGLIICLLEVAFGALNLNGAVWCAR